METTKEAGPDAPTEALRPRPWARLRTSLPGRWSGLDRVAAGIVLIQLTGLAAAALPGSFYGDDLPRMSQAARAPLSWGYLTDEVFGHLTPGYRLAYWVQVRIAPMDHVVAVVYCLVAQALVSGAFWLLLRKMFGRRALILLPFVAFTLSAAQLPTFLWWSAAINLLPAQLAIISGILAHLHVLSGRRNARGGVVVSLVLGMLFWEKVALLVIELPLLTLAVTAGSWTVRIRRAVSLWRLWLTYLFPVGMYLLLFKIGGYGSPRQSVSLSETVRFIGVSLGQALAPAMVGGPLEWSRVGPYFSVARPSSSLTVGATAILLGFLIVAIRRDHRTASASALLLLVPVVLSAVVTAVTRFGFFGFNVARDYRYSADLMVPALLAIMIATVGVRSATTGAASTDQPGPTGRLGTGRRALQFTSAALVIVLFLGVATVSGFRYARVWAENPVGRYLANARRTLASPPGEQPIGVYDLPVPSFVLDPVYGPDNQLSRVLAPLRNPPVFDSPGEVLGILDDDGLLRAADVSTVALSAPGPAGECHWFANDGDVTVDMLRLAPVGNYVVQVSYLARAATTANVVTRRRRVKAPTFTSRTALQMSKGLGTLVVQAPRRAIDSVDVTDLSADVCILQVAVQRVRPRQPTTGRR